MPSAAVARRPAAGPAHSHVATVARPVDPMGMAARAGGGAAGAAARTPVPTSQDRRSVLVSVRFGGLLRTATHAPM